MLLIVLGILIVVIIAIVLYFLLKKSAENFAASRAAITANFPQLHTYWESWNASPPVSQVPYMNFNVLNLAFANVDVAHHTPATGDVSYSGVSGLPDITNLVAACHNLGKRVKVAIGGATYLLNVTVESADACAAAIANYVNANKLDGVDLDVEQDPKPSAEAQIALIKALRAKMPSKLLSYTPKTPAMQVEPYKSTILGAHTYLNSISFMAYDSLPGYKYTDDVTAMLAANIPAGKIVVGLMPGPDDLNPPVVTSVFDIRSVCSFILNNNLGGMMLWDLNRDANNSTKNIAADTACQILKCCTAPLCVPKSFNENATTTLRICPTLDGLSPGCQQASRTLSLSWRQMNPTDVNRITGTVTLSWDALNSWVNDSSDEHCGINCGTVFGDLNAQCAGPCGSIYVPFSYFILLDYRLPEDARPLDDMIFPVPLKWHSRPNTYLSGNATNRPETDNFQGYLRVLASGYLSFMASPYTSEPFPANKALQIPKFSVTWTNVKPCTTPTSNYRCNSDANCVADDKGRYSDIGDCRAHCGHDRYRCDLGLCYRDVEGPWDNKDECQANCVYPSVNG